MTTPDEGFTLIPIQYRDAANYKMRAVVVAEGRVGHDALAVLRDALDGSDEHFVATQVGLPHLGAAMVEFPGDGDHVWHEMWIDEVEFVAVAPTGPDALFVGPVADFVARMTAASKAGWADHLPPGT